MAAVSADYEALAKVSENLPTPYTIDPGVERRPAHHYHRGARGDGQGHRRMLTPAQVLSLIFTDHVGYPDYLTELALDGLTAAGFAIVRREEYTKLAALAVEVLS